MNSEHKQLACVSISVRWRDMDAMGHVNNAKYVSYLEEARVRWMLGVEGVSMNDRIAPVVANTNINYRLPIVWPDDIVVELFVETPTDLTARQKELLQELALSFGEAQNPRNSSFAGEPIRSSTAAGSVTSGISTRMPVAPSLVTVASE